jgi:hypothetical protein
LGLELGLSLVCGTGWGFCGHAGISVGVDKQWGQGWVLEWDQGLVQVWVLEWDQELDQLWGQAWVLEWDQERGQVLVQEWDQKWDQVWAKLLLCSPILSCELIGY